MVIELNGSFKLHHLLGLRICVWKITSNYYYNAEEFQEK